jgi:hypothetical protein
MAGEIQDRVQGSKSLAKVMEFDRKLAKIASQKAPITSQATPLK